MFFQGTVTNLGPSLFPGSTNGPTSAAAINNAGTIAGYGVKSDMVEHACLYAGGAFVDLGTLGGTDGFGHDINEAGQIVGDSDLSGANTPHAFLYSGGGPMQNLGTLGGGQSIAWGIGNNGTVVGRSLIADGSTWHAFLYLDGTMHDRSAGTGARRPHGHAAPRGPHPQAR